jgi:hypothetical protein
MDITVSGAYGRDYRSKAAAIADWNADKDFRVRSMGMGGYVNRADALRTSAEHIHIRYRKDTMVVIIPNE